MVRWMILNFFLSHICQLHLVGDEVQGFAVPASHLCRNMADKDPSKKMKYRSSLRPRWIVIIPSVIFFLFGFQILRVGVYRHRVDTALRKLGVYRRIMEYTKIEYVSCNTGALHVAIVSLFCCTVPPSVHSCTA